MEDLHVSIKYLVSVFPLNWVLFSKFGPQIEYQFSFISCLNKGQGLRPWAVHTYPKLMGAPPGANFVSTTIKTPNRKCLITDYLRGFSGNLQQYMVGARLPNCLWSSLQSMKERVMNAPY